MEDYFYMRNLCKTLVFPLLTDYLAKGLQPGFIGRVVVHLTLATEPGSGGWPGRYSYVNRVVELLFVHSIHPSASAVIGNTAQKIFWIS